ncbi:MAG: YeeE/YedE family protein [Myxococcales bacterium]|nr:YeeE/YedE family protein [Myxococcales bacterium]
MENLTIWAGWAGGIGVGLVVALLYWTTGKGLGVSAAYGEVCGLAGSDFFKRGTFAGPRWRLFFALGLPIGGAIAVLTSGISWAPTWDMGTLYPAVLPDSTWIRGGVLAAGGALIGIGARMAGGCQSGHAITGMALLNPPSVLAGGLFFVGGIVSVQTLFGLFS